MLDGDDVDGQIHKLFGIRADLDVEANVMYSTVVLKTVQDRCRCFLSSMDSRPGIPALLPCDVKWGSDGSVPGCSEGMSCRFSSFSFFLSSLSFDVMTVDVTSRWL